MEFKVANLGGEITYVPFDSLQKTLAELEKLTPNLFAEVKKIIDRALEGILLGTAGARHTADALAVFTTVSNAMDPIVLRATLRLMRLQEELQREQEVPSATATVPPGIEASLQGMDLTLEGPDHP